MNNEFTTKFTSRKTVTMQPSNLRQSTGDVESQRARAPWEGIWSVAVILEHRPSAIFASQPHTEFINLLLIYIFHLILLEPFFTSNLLMIERNGQERGSRLLMPVTTSEELLDLPELLLEFISGILLDILELLFELLNSRASLSNLFFFSVFSGFSSSCSERARILPFS